MNEDALEDRVEPIELVFRMLSGDRTVGEYRAEEGALEDLFAVLAPDFKFHARSAVLDGDFEGLEGFVEYINRLYALIPHVESTVRSLVSDDVFLLSLTDAQIESAAGGTANVSLCTVSRVSDGKIAEAWQLSSSLNDPAGIRRALKI